MPFFSSLVSGLNACHCCYGVHSETAKAFGLPEGVLEALLTDPESVQIDPRMRSLLAYAKKLTLTPSRMS